MKTGQVSLPSTGPTSCCLTSCPQPHSSQPCSLAGPNPPSGHAHSAWLWPLHLPPWRWLRPPGSCGSDLPAEPAAPQALQPVDTPVQGLASLEPTRPLLLPPSRKLPQKTELLESRRRNCLKASREEAKTHWRGQRPCQRQTQRPRQSVDSCRRWSVRTERPLRPASHQRVFRAQSLLGALERDTAAFLCKLCYMHVIHGYVGVSKAQKVPPELT